MKKIVLISLILGIGISGPFLTTARGQQVKQQDSYDEPTVVNRGQLTKKEKEYSKEYRKLYPNQNRKLSEGIKLAQAKGYTGEIGRSLGIPMIPTVGPSPTAAELLKDLGCKSDAIVLGSSKSKTAHLTVDETWVYTEYDLLVKDILKNNSASPIRAASTIQITRPGGLIKLDGYVFRVMDPLYDWLKKNEEYVLFLKFVPSTQGYLVSSAYGDFERQGNKFKGLSRLGLPKDLRENDYKTMLNSVRTSVSSGCSKQMN